MHRTFRLACLIAIGLALLFGISGCATPDWDNAENKAKAMASEPTVVREGDILRISSRDAPTLNSVVQVRRDGKVSLSMINEVTAAGKTPRELEQELLKLYEPHVDVKEIIVTLESAGFPVYVTGAVMQPRKILSDHPITVLEAIMEAGGPNYATANLKGVRVIRNVNGRMEHHTVNIKAVLGGNSAETFYLKPNDIIYVPERFSWL